MCFSVEIIGELRMDPFANLHNCLLDDETTAIEELKPVAKLGGRTVVDPTCGGAGRNPAGLAKVARGTGLNIVMGAGYYLEGAHPAAVKDMTPDDVADQIVREAHEGVDGTGVRIGIIGEIGISADFTAEEEKVLRGATRGHVRTGLPLMIHLPGYKRYAHRVLDVIEAEGGDLTHTVLCHMNPSGTDTDYQFSVARRGAFLEYDMVGMDYFYANEQYQSPSDEENARAIKGLVDAGFGRQVLVSQDVFLKMMLSRNGGFGYAYIQKHFIPRLKRHGVTDAEIDALMVGNPHRVFAAA
jgi:phosphotriesterase-related protein